MAQCDKLLAKARNNPRGLRFSELERLARCYDFYLDRTRGSHHVYKHDGLRVVLNAQPAGSGKAKTYQVKQLLTYIARLEGD